MMTLVEVAKTVQDSFRRGILETVYSEIKAMQYFPFKTSTLAYSYNQRESLPDVHFRNINEAFQESTGIVNRRVETLKPFGGDSDTDKVLVDAYGNESRLTNDKAHATAMAVKFAETALYGNSGDRTANAYDDVKGFDGIMARCTSGQTVDAGGVLGSAGSTVFAIRFGDGFCSGLQTAAGVDARDLGEVDDKPAYRSRIDQTAGLCIENGKAVAMIQNLESALCNLTADMMDELVDKLQGDPSVFFMSKRSRRQLKKDAKATVSLSITLDQLGKPILSWDGVPIFADDFVIDTEVTS